MNFKLSKNKMIGGLALILILLASFWYGGNAPGLQGWAAAPPPEKEVSSLYLEEEEELEEIEEIEEIEEAEQIELDEALDLEELELAEVEVEVEVEEVVEEAEEKETVIEAAEPEEIKAPVKEVEVKKPEPKPEPKPKSEPKPQPKPEAKEMVISKETGKDQYQTEAVPEGKPVPMEPQNAKITDVAHTATLSVRSDTILDNMDWLNPDKVELVPEDGVIFAKTQVTFYEGESVFNVLQREMKKAKIHMEFVNTPIYNSAYIEGINNLYEFDCGELSGWMYKVNNWFPNYGSSRYQLKAGDVIEWQYSCNLGEDIGGNNSMRR